jgi:hypothetical protein
MAAIEILAYSPFFMNDYLSFVEVGKPNGAGGFETDGRRRMKIGVIRWLLGREVPEAHFFNTPVVGGPGLNLFMALVERPGTEVVPWMGRIAGFDEMINIDGRFGETTSLGPITNLLATLTSNTGLDNAFAQGKINVQQVLARIAELSVDRATFLRTLRSDVGTDPKAVFDEVKAKLGITL